MKEKKLAIQTLPVDYTSVIPVGLITDAGKEITFSITTLNLPEEVEVLLEDKKNGVFTNLTETNYKTTLDETVNGTGQFYIHTAAKSLSNNDLNIENISVYNSSKSTITITGLNTNATLKLYSLLGQKVVETKILANGVNKIDLPNLTAGVYMVTLTSERGEISKKIVVN